MRLLRGLFAFPVWGAVLLGTSACGVDSHEATVSEVAVVGAEDALSYAVYGAIQTTGLDTLKGLRIEGGEGSLHTMTMVGGLMKMEAVELIPIADGGLHLTSGRIHGMLEALDRPLVPGDSVTLQFDFARAGLVEIPAPVMSPTDFVSRSNGPAR